MWSIALALLVAGPLIGLIASLVSRLAIVQLLRRFGVSEAGNPCSGSVSSKLRCLIELLLSLLIALAVIWMFIAWFISLPTMLGAFLTIVAFHLIATFRTLPEYKHSALSLVAQAWAGSKARLRRALSLRRRRTLPAEDNLLLEQQKDSSVAPNSQPMTVASRPVPLLADLVNAVEESASGLAKAADELKAMYQEYCNFAGLVAGFKQFAISKELQSALSAEMNRREQAVEQQVLLVSQARHVLDQRNQALESARSGLPAAQYNPQATLDRATAVLDRAQELLSKQQE